ncbi:NADH-quinone oxidoreductase subunit J [Tessaracoccus caeni]|uniref:NADH-quinone oxidoreductase subunit J n=1 Tax=Tessaracoccus caeni TaxID=3031239 RepID=UPI0023DB1D61|nr:NADH-quinone oxidoreductase subunit J [Tessaracoccus caeni]MDF1487052.1 NADH-quinone oxidoreductase subunit J [Tessaracoccus caeni]
MITLTPLVTGADVAFWATAPIIVICALALLLSRKPVHSAIAMAGVMVGLAVLYAAQDAPFLFVIQIIVYTGAILMLFLFVVMLIGVDATDSVVETIKGHRVAATVAVIGLGILLIAAVGQLAVLGEPVGLAEANAAQDGNIPSIAALLFTDYVLTFEISGALIIVAAVGAMVLAHGEKLKEKKTQEDLAAERVEAYVEEGTHPGPLPSSGVFARHNAIHIPALLPDGSVAEKSLSKTLMARGVVVDVDELRAPTESTLKALTQADADAEGEQA